MNKRQSFYHSAKWLDFIRLLRVQRTRDGVLYCERCGQPIIKPYDCIAHHIIELTDNNIDDTTISLNPDNIKLLHFKCHNAEHHRFGAKAYKQVFLIYGAPCAGKQEYVDSVAESSDIVYNIDRLWAAIRSSSCGIYQKPNELKQNVFALRDTIYDNIKTRYGKWNNAYIIGGYPLCGERERLIDSLGIDKAIFIDTDKETCLLRAKAKDISLIEFVNAWFEKFTP